MASTVFPQHAEVIVIGEWTALTTGNVFVGMLMGSCRDIQMAGVFKGTNHRNGEDWVATAAIFNIKALFLQPVLGWAKAFVIAFNSGSGFEVAFSARL